MTMAVKQYHLSKLDIFTPNVLHPTLPALAHGEYTVMGGVATSKHTSAVTEPQDLIHLVIYEPHLAARRDYILGLLSDDDRLNVNIRKRIRRHDELNRHMGSDYLPGLKVWTKGFYGRPVKPSMETPESKDKFVKAGLQKEWAAMGIKGVLADTYIELSDLSDEGQC